MIKYYVGIGKQLLKPEQCDGPFSTPEEAKEFMREFDIAYMPPEFHKMTISQVDDEKRTIDFYKENGQPVTMEIVHRGIV